MPRKSGFEVALELTAALGAERPLLIAMSAIWTGTNERLLAHSLGFDHFVQKAADPTGLA
jgi:DNA-binding response OmpR family regulator